METDKVSRPMKGLSDNEKEFLEALMQNHNLTSACKQLGISVSVGSRRKTNIVAKYMRAKELIKEVDYYKMRMASLLGI